jgi:hypothetical protein
MVLRRESLGHSLVAGQQSNPTFAPIECDVALGKLVQVERLMGAMKAADSDVNYGRPQLRPRVRRPSDCRAEPRESGLAE